MKFEHLDIKKILLVVAVTLLIIMSGFSVKLAQEEEPQYTNGSNLMDSADYDSDHPYFKNYRGLGLNILRYQGGKVFGMEFHDEQLHIIDVSRPNKPELIATIEGGRQEFHSFQPMGKWLYIGGWNEFWVVDISDTTNPETMGKCQVDNPVKALTAYGNYAYLSQGDNLSVVNLADPANPEIVADWPVGGLGFDILVEGTRLYLAQGSLGVKIYDITNPEEPGFLGSFREEKGDILDLELKGDILYYCGGRIAALDVSDPSAPGKIWDFNQSREFSWDSNLRERTLKFFSLTRDGDRLFAADSSFYMLIFDIENEKEPKEKGYFPSYSSGHATSQFAVFGDYLYSRDIYELEEEKNPDFWDPLLSGWLLTLIGELFIFAVVLNMRWKRLREKKRRDQPDIKESQRKQEAHTNNVSHQPPLQTQEETGGEGKTAHHGDQEGEGDSGGKPGN